MSIEFLLACFVGFVLTLIIAFAGSKRSIGFGWPLFLGLFLTPVVSFVAVVLSERNKPNENGIVKRKWGCLIPLILTIAIVASIAIYYHNYTVERDEARNMYMKTRSYRN